MQKDVLTRDDIDHCFVGRPCCADAGHRRGRVYDTRRVLIRPLEDGYQPFNEVEKAFFGRGLVHDSVDQRPQGVTAHLICDVRHL